MASGSEPAIPIPVDSPADEWSDNEASEISSEIITREEVSIMCISLCNHGYSKDYEWLVSSDFFLFKRVLVYDIIFRSPSSPKDSANIQHTVYYL